MAAVLHRYRDSRLYVWSYDHRRSHGRGAAPRLIPAVPSAAVLAGFVRTTGIGSGPKGRADVSAEPACLASATGQTSSTCPMSEGLSKRLRGAEAISTRRRARALRYLAEDHIGALDDRL